MKRVLLIGTGGTIASLPTEQGLRPGITSEELFQSVPEILELCQVETIQLLNIDSTNIQPEDWLLLSKTIEAHYREFDGFVITHGTDTMAYSAAALTYLIQHPDKPIVLTGSQKPLRDTMSDAHKNLADSCCLACENGVGGVYLVFCGQVILGTRARKMKTKSCLAFDSINYPVAAFIDNRRILRYTPLEGDGAPVRFYHRLSPKVFLLKLIPGMEPDILDYVSDHYDAVVIESYGVGGLPFVERRDFLKKMDSLTRKGCIVLLATQAMLEGSDATLYEVGFQAMSDYHLLQAYDMTIEAVVTKLMWLLGQTQDYQQLRSLFYTPVARDILTAVPLSSFTS